MHQQLKRNMEESFNKLQQAHKAGTLYVEKGTAQIRPEVLKELKPSRFWPLVQIGLALIVWLVIGYIAVCLVRVLNLLAERS